MKPFSIINGNLEINVSDLHTFLKQFGVKFSSLSDIHVKPVGIIIQIEVENPPFSDARQEEMIEGFTDLIDEEAEKDNNPHHISRGWLQHR